MNSARRFWRASARRARDGAAAALACLIFWWALVAVAGPISFPITAPDGTQVGEVRVSESADGTGVEGAFTATYPQPPPEENKPSLAEAASKCGEDHFNWLQIVLEDNMPPNGSDGKPLKPPYLDPPLGGYGPPDTQWADNLPWYWDEGPDPPPGTPGWEDGYNLQDRLQDHNGDGVLDTLGYQDFPDGPVGTSLLFGTWLASVNADGSLHSLHGGFLWTWERKNPGVATLLYPVSANMGYGYYNVVMGIPEPASFVLAAVALACMMTAAALSRQRASRVKL